MKTRAIFLTVIAVFTLAIVSCTENIDESTRYVFKERVITDYLREHAQFSEYYKLLGEMPVSKMSSTTCLQLLSARGHYTVFAPTNDAIQLYLDTLVKQDIIDSACWNGFRDEKSLDSIKKVIVYNSIIDGGNSVQFELSDFPTTNQAEIPMSNMYDRKLAVTYSVSDPEAIYVGDCPIDKKNRDIFALNGIIHEVLNVIAPSNDALSDLLSNIIENKEKGYYVAAILAQAVGMMDTLSRIRDEKYEDMYVNGLIPDPHKETEHRTKWAPEHRYIGFTYFAETDEFWSRTLGKEATDIVAEDVFEYIKSQNIYPDAERNKDYKSENNLLNRFVTYHFLPMMLGPDRLVLHYNEKGYNEKVHTLGVCMTEFYTTMGRPRLLKILESYESKGVYLNRFPELDNGRRGTYHELRCEADKEGILVEEPNRIGKYNIRNAVVYPINKLLIYDDATRDNMASQRIRWDACAMFPEMMTNDIRLPELTDERHMDAGFPTDKTYRYLENAWISEETVFSYSSGRGRGFRNYLSDEFQIWGILDVTIKMPPVPKRGTYELRYGIQNGDNSRSMVQCYWGTDKERLYAEGLPLDTRIGGMEIRNSAGNFPSGMGWEPDTEDDDYNAEVDKKLKNNDFMKGVEIMCKTPTNATTLRADADCVRRVILRKTLDPDETYYVRFKGVLDDAETFLYMDFFEYCPKEVYDNPNKPEDIW